MREYVFVLAGVSGQGMPALAQQLAEGLFQRGYQVAMRQEGLEKQGYSRQMVLRAGEKEEYSPIKPGEADCLIALERLEGLKSLSFLRPDGKLFLGKAQKNPPLVSAGRISYPDVSDSVFEEKGYLPVPLEELGIKPVLDWLDSQKDCITK